jgi:hypothetical protein
MRVAVTLANWKFVIKRLRSVHAPKAQSCQMRDTKRENDWESADNQDSSTRSEWNAQGGKAFVPSAKVNDSLKDTTFVAFATSV